jgi:dTDP-4-amino-4,6-dideoxygalactose transaminase
VAARILPYLRQIDANRFYSNAGPLARSLRSRLAEHFGLDAAQVALAGNGTAGLTAATLAAAGRATAARPHAIVPAYTFIATACAVEACGFRPWLADIDERTLALDPGGLAGSPALAGAGLVMPVAPYGRMVDLAAWDRFMRDTGIPVVVDAAAAFDTLDPAAVAATGVPVCISLHATKTFSTAEGGLILCGDRDRLQRVARALNFGFEATRDSHGPSLNGKMTEYQAAIGLAELDGWAEKRAGFMAAARAYRDAAGSAGLGERIWAEPDRAVPYALLTAADADAAAAARTALDAARIEHRLWYGAGLQAQPHLATAGRDPLPVTAAMAPRVVGLPMSVDLRVAEVARVVRVLARAAGQAA